MQYVYNSELFATIGISFGKYSQNICSSWMCTNYTRKLDLLFLTSEEQITSTNCFKIKLYKYSVKIC